MARRNSYKGGRWYNRPDAAYARSSGWPTRYYQRKISGAVFSSNAGLNVTDDDFQRNDGESPYLLNARLNGTKEKVKRAQLMSRRGHRAVAKIDSLFSTEIPSSENCLENMLWVSTLRHIRFKPQTTHTTIYSVKLVVNKVENYTQDDNMLLCVVNLDSNGQEKCRSCCILYDAGDYLFTFIDPDFSDGGYIEIFLYANTYELFESDTKVYLSTTGQATCEYADFAIPNVNGRLTEEAPSWFGQSAIPYTEITYTEYKTVNTWLQNGYFTSGFDSSGSTDGSRYTVMAVRNPSDNSITLYKIRYAIFDYTIGQLKLLDSPQVSVLSSGIYLDTKATDIRMTQAGNELFIVDGWSPLQVVNLETWAGSNAVPDVTEVDTYGWMTGMYYYKDSVIIADDGFWRCKEDHEAAASWSEDQVSWEAKGIDELTAWPGASLIYFHNNRLILGGFKNVPIGTGVQANRRVEPNLVNLSSITSVQPNYKMFNKATEFFYVPDYSPSRSVASPVTGFAHIGDYLLIFTADGMAIEEIASAVEFAGITQSNPEGGIYGCMRQEHIAEGLNMIYFYNQANGIIRTAGSTSSIVSEPIDALLEGVSDEDKYKVVLAMERDLLHVYMPERFSSGKENSISLVDYTSISQHKSYWYMDSQTPFRAYSYDKNGDYLFLVHSQMPVLLKGDDDIIADMGCAIPFVYHTKYITANSRSDEIIVRRLHIHALQQYPSCLHVGLDLDHSNHPLLWTKYLVPKQFGSDYGLRFQDETSNEATSAQLDIRILTDDCKYAQLRLYQYCFNQQAEIMMMGMEYASKTVL